MSIDAELVVTGPTVDVPRVDLEAVIAKASAENFPVASRLVPARFRAGLVAIYAYARFIDDLGDAYEGDRDEALDWAESQLDRALAGEPAPIVFAQAAELASTYATGRAPFADLIAANRLDQVQTRYERFSDLETYCKLSANPVGRLVLALFGASSERTVALSDRVCTGLQLVEHWQDLAEDFGVGRIYLPAVDREDFGVDEHDLEAPSASAALRRLVAFECGRARELLESGSALVALLHGSARIAVAGFVGGGLAQLDTIERRGFDVLGTTARATKQSVATHTVRVLLRSLRRA